MEEIPAKAEYDTDDTSSIVIEYNEKIAQAIEVERDKLIEELKAREDAEILRVTYENRGSLHEILIEKAFDFLAETTKE